VTTTVTGANHGFRAALRTWLSIGSRLRTFNVAMGMLLAATALWLAML
jgi:hypothetical protein